MRAQTPFNLTAALLANGFQGRTDTWAVVGNGPLRLLDRPKIAAADVVLRFNDLKNKWGTERTDVYVLRHPSWISFKSANAYATLHVGALPDHIPTDAALFEFVYEAQYTDENVASSGERIFEGCECGASCLHASAIAGPSTGAVALSALQEEPSVKQIEIFGMNWLGDENLHIDFANSSIVTACCTKCSFHETASDDYGSDGTVLFLAFVAVSVIVLALFVLYEGEQEAVYLYHRHRHHHAEGDCAAGAAGAAGAADPAPPAQSAPPATMPLLALAD